MRAPSFILIIYMRWAFNLDILSNKLNFVGIRGIANHWLLNRLQHVRFDSHPTDLLALMSPRALYWALCYFIYIYIYINDLYKVSNKLCPIMFADDSSFILSADDPIRLNLS